MTSTSSTSDTKEVFTVGHSIHSIEYFLGLLTQHQISALADVRSAPYSRFNPQFNRECLATDLRKTGIQYVYLGNQLGGRSDDETCYENGRIRYDRVARKPAFEQGLQRVVAGAENYRIALMCSEKEPLSCHRTLLVGHALVEHGVRVTHIRGDGSLESHDSAMTRLLAQFDMHRADDLFEPRKERRELVVEAISRQAEQFGHVIESNRHQKRTDL